MKGLQNFPRRLKVPWHDARLQFNVQLKGTLCKLYSYRPENMARFGTQKEASRTKSIKFPFPFIFLGIVFYQIVGLQVGQAETLWPRDTYGEYKRIELWRSKHLSHVISISSYGCRKMSNVLQRRLVTVRRLTDSFIGRYKYDERQDNHSKMVFGCFFYSK